MPSNRASRDRRKRPLIYLRPLSLNHQYYGDNLDILRGKIYTDIVALGSYPSGQKPLSRI